MFDRLSCIEPISDRCRRQCGNDNIYLRCGEVDEQKCDRAADKSCDDESLILEGVRPETDQHSGQHIADDADIDREKPAKYAADEATDNPAGMDEDIYTERAVCRPSTAGELRQIDCEGLIDDTLCEERQELFGMIFQVCCD